MKRPANGVAAVATTLAMLLLPFGLGAAVPALASDGPTAQSSSSPEPTETHESESSDDEGDEEHTLTEAEKQAAEAAAKAAELAREAAKKAAEDAAEAQKIADEAAKKAAEDKSAESQALAEKAASAAKLASQAAAQAKKAAIEAGRKRHELSDLDKHAELKSKYGGLQDISTPPLLIKPKLNSGASGANSSNDGNSSGDSDDGFVSSPLDVTRHQLNGGSVSLSDGSHDADFNTNVNEPVINNIVATDYSSPADEFMAKAYFAMGVLAIGALIMAGGLLRPKATED
ncbi:MAG: hypothetical protein ACKORF_04060 [Micrococcales bacterium]